MNTISDAAERRAARKRLLASATDTENHLLNSRAFYRQLAAVAADRKAAGVTCAVCDGTDHTADACPHGDSTESQPCDRGTTGCSVGRHTDIDSECETY